MDKSYTIKICMTDKELNILKKALQAYKGASRITEDLLSFIKYQEDKQNEI